MQPDGLAAGRQIRGSSPIPAMDRGADRPTCRAAGVIALRFGDDSDRGGAVPHDTHEAAARHRKELGHAPICEAKPTAPRPSCHDPRSTKLADEPLQWGRIRPSLEGSLPSPERHAMGVAQGLQPRGIGRRATVPSRPCWVGSTAGGTDGRLLQKPAAKSCPRFASAAEACEAVLCMIMSVIDHLREGARCRT